MQISRVLYGTTVNKTWKAFNGLTLFTPLSSKTPRLINMAGDVIKEWQMPYTPALYGELLPNGHLLYAGHVPDGPLADFEGAGGEIIEVDFDGKPVWSHKDSYLHHAFLRMDNGNTMVLRWVQVPKDIAAKVSGGLSGTERDGVMWGDCFQEIDPQGRVVWEWNAHEHLRPEEFPICALCERDLWTQANCIFLTPEGDILTSFRRTSYVCVISRSTGEVTWKWGLGEISHANSATMVENGNVLVFDNGIHAFGVHFPFSRVVEIDPRTNSMVWAWHDKDNENRDFYGAFMSGAQRLPNGNTLMTEAEWGRLFEVNQKGEIVWEYLHPEYAPFPNYGTNNVIPIAFRYDPAYSGFPGPKVPINPYRNPKPMVEREGEGEAKKEAPAKDRVQSRLDSLGY